MNARSSNFSEHCSLDQLTPREAEILTHLVQHKTSKQIARDLELSEGTVNKAIFAARSKWQARDRMEAARIFERLCEGDRIYTPQILPGDAAPDVDAEPLADLPRTSEVRFSDVLAMGYRDEPDVPAPVGLEALDRRFGKIWRAIAIPGIALLIAMALTCVVAIAWMTSNLN